MARITGREALLIEGIVLFYRGTSGIFSASVSRWPKSMEQQDPGFLLLPRLFGTDECDTQQWYVLYRRGQTGFDLDIRTERDREFTLCIKILWWIQEGSVILVNGVEVEL